MRLNSVTRGWISRCDILRETQISQFSDTKRIYEIDRAINRLFDFFYR
jgi:hypothetical protein